MNNNNFIKVPSIFIGTICLIIGSAIGVFAIYLYLTLVLGDGFVATLTGSHGVVIGSNNNPALNTESLASLGNLIRNGHVLTQEQLIAAMSQFYSDLINILLVIIGVLGVIGFLYIKGISKYEAHQIAKEEAEDYTSSDKFKEDVAQRVEEKASEYIDPLMNDFDSFVSENQWEERITKIEEFIASQDSSDRENAETMISSDTTEDS